MYSIETREGNQWENNNDNDNDYVFTLFDGDLFENTLELYII